MILMFGIITMFITMERAITILMAQSMKAEN